MDTLPLPFESRFPPLMPASSRTSAAQIARLGFDRQKAQHPPVEGGCSFAWWIAHVDHLVPNDDALVAELFAELPQCPTPCACDDV